MGATTENPSFRLIRPLLSLSRCRVLVLRPLRPHVVELLLKWAASASDNKGLTPKVWMPGIASSSEECAYQANERTYLGMHGYTYPPDNPSASVTQAYLPPSLGGYDFSIGRSVVRAPKPNPTDERPLVQASRSFEDGNMI